jgi:hypothetical protein
VCVRELALVEIASAIKATAPAVGTVAGKLFVVLAWALPVPDRGSYIYSCVVPKSKPSSRCPLAAARQLRSPVDTSPDSPLASLSQEQTGIKCVKLMGSMTLEQRAKIIDQFSTDHTTNVSFLGDAKSSLGDAKRSLGDAKRSLGDAKSSLGDAKSSLGDAKSSLGDAKSSLGDAESSLGHAESSLGDAKSSLGESKSSLGDAKRFPWVAAGVPDEPQGRRRGAQPHRRHARVPHGPLVVRAAHLTLTNP